MIPTFMSNKAIARKPEPPPTGRVERVMLARFNEVLRQNWHMVGVTEGMVGDEVLARFGEGVVQVPPEMLVAASGKGSGHADT